MGYLPAMCDYALESDDSEQRTHLLREAAYERYVPAMYHFGLSPVIRRHGNSGSNGLPSRGTLRRC